MKRLLSFLAAAPLFAQLAALNPDGVRMGHVHLAVRDVDAQKAFWTGVMGGKLVKNGPLEMVEFPGVYLLFRKSDNPASPAGSVVNHFGFVVKDMPAALAKWKAAGLKVEPTENPNESFVHAPDDIRLEVYGIPELDVPVKMNHIHYNVTDIPGMQTWYQKVFGATAGKRPCVACVSRPSMVETGNLPGDINLSYSGARTAQAPTKGRAIDHIGFDVRDLEGLAKKLESQGITLEAPIRQIPNTNLKIAFLTDPWGTYIELTEGLAPTK